MKDSHFDSFLSTYTFFIMFSVAPSRSSSFIEDIDYNLNDTQVRVAFKNESIQFYDVTLNAIQELLNPLTSFGFWFNKYCR